MTTGNLIKDTSVQTKKELAKSSKLDQVTMSNKVDTSNEGETVDFGSSGIDSISMVHANPVIQDEPSLININVTPTPPKPFPCADFVEVCGGEGGLKENSTNLQEGNQRGGNLAHVLHKHPCTELSFDSRAPATLSMQTQSSNPQYKEVQHDPETTPVQKFPKGSMAKDMGNFS